MGEWRARGPQLGELGSRLSAEVAGRYVDVWGRSRTIDPQVKRALVKALGQARNSVKKAIIEPGKCYLPPQLTAGHKLWGFTVQLYGVRSARRSSA